MMFSPKMTHVMIIDFKRSLVQPPRHAPAQLVPKKRTWSHSISQEKMPNVFRSENRHAGGIGPPANTSRCDAECQYSSSGKMEEIRRKKTLSVIFYLEQTPNTLKAD